MNIISKPTDAVTKILKLDLNKLYDFDIKEHRDKRSKNANAYSWVLISKIAEALHSDKDTIYLQELQKYGVFTHIIVKPSAVDKFKNEWRYVEDLGNVSINGNTGNQFKCYFGSSNYDTKEMARFIDGIVEDCKDLNIETMTPQEIELLKKEWR